MSVQMHGVKVFGRLVHELNLDPISFFNLKRWRIRIRFAIDRECHFPIAHFGIQIHRVFDVIRIVEGKITLCSLAVFGDIDDGHISFFGFWFG